MGPKRLSHFIRENVLGLVAIFIALSGTAWAAAQIGASDIKEDAVRSKHIKDGQVKGQDVDPAQVQLRVGSSCPAGEAIRVINVEGGVACEVDDSGGGGPPTGPAGGDLTDTYPNPSIALGAVDSAKVEDNSLTSDDLAADSVGNDEVLGEAIGSEEIKDDSIAVADLGLPWGRTLNLPNQPLLSFHNTGANGIGLQVSGEPAITATSLTNAAPAVRGSNFGDGTGVWGSSGGLGTAVLGINGGTGQGFGVRGVSNRTGVKGQTPADGDALVAEGGYLDLALVGGAPPAVDCDEPTEAGRVKFDAVQNRLYVCSYPVWKFVALD